MLAIIANTSASVAPLLGRILLSLIFLMSGVHKLSDWGGTADNMREQGMAAVHIFLAGAVLLELGGGLSVLFGCWARLGAAALIVFLIPTTIIFHNFWALADAERQHEMIHFMKNLAILGGLFVVVGSGAGCCSCDSWRAAHKTSPAEQQPPPVQED